MPAEDVADTMVDDMPVILLFYCRPWLIFQYVEFLLEPLSGKKIRECHEGLYLLCTTPSFSLTLIIYRYFKNGIE